MVKFLSTNAIIIVSHMRIYSKDKLRKENKSMRKTRTIETSSKVTVNAETLAKILDCGRPTAMKIGADAGARIQIGKRVLYKVDKVNEYLNHLAEESKGQEIDES